MKVSLHRLLTHRAIVVATFATTFALFILAFTAPAVWAAPGVAGSDRPVGIDISDGGRDLVRAGGDLVVRAGETVESVTVFGGDAIVAGTVRRSVVAIGGDVVLRPSARVGTAMSPDDATVFAVGGTVRTAPGAIVTGSTGAWEDVTSGEAIVAAAVAMSGMAVAAAILVALGVGLLVAGALATAIVIAAFIWLIVWLVRRDAGSTAGPAYASTAVPAYVSPAVPGAQPAYGTDPAAAATLPQAQPTAYEPTA